MPYDQAHGREPLNGELMCMDPDAASRPDFGTPEWHADSTDGSRVGYADTKRVYAVPYSRQHGPSSKPALCTVCRRPMALQTYVQWAREQCSNGHLYEASAAAPERRLATHTITGASPCASSVRACDLV